MSQDLKRQDFVDVMRSVNDRLQKLERAFRPIMVGIVASDGSIIKGSGFTAIKTGTGAYTITFDNAYEEAPIVIVGLEWSNNSSAVRTAAPSSTTEQTVQGYNPSTGAAADVRFSFAVFMAS